MVFLSRPWVRGEGGPRAPTPPELRLSPAGCRAPGTGASRCDRGVLNRGGKRLQPVNPGTVLGVFFGLPAAALSAGEAPLPTPAGAPPAPDAPPEVFARSQPEPGGAEPGAGSAPCLLRGSAAPGGTSCCGAAVSAVTRLPPARRRRAASLPPLPVGEEEADPKSEQSLSGYQKTPREMTTQGRNAGQLENTNGWLELQVLRLPSLTVMLAVGLTRKESAQPSRGGSPLPPLEPVFAHRPAGARG